MTRIEFTQIGEPSLEFGDGTDSRVKEGLAAGGPYSLQLRARHPSAIRLGFVGPTDDLELAERFVRGMEQFIPALGHKDIQRPAFLGFSRTFQSQIAFDASWRYAIKEADIADAVAMTPESAFVAALELWTRGIEELSQRDPPPDVIVCAIPNTVTEYCGSIRVGERNSDRYMKPTLFDDPASIEAATGPAGLLERDFRRALKAAAMRSSVPIQILTPNLYGPIPGRFDDPASRSWNLAVALFYKAGGVPWRLADPEVDALYIGISFHHRWRMDGHGVYSGLAQAFYPGSEGFALRGGRAEKSPDDLRLRLDRAEMSSLVRRVLDHYTLRTARDPRRVVVHKTTSFDDDEVAGARDALDNVPETAFVALRSSKFRILRQGDYPPRRGMFARLEDRGFLLTTGYQDNRRTYKGSHIPVPIDLITSSDPRAAAHDVMALTKLNWNSAADHTQFPVTLAFAQKVGTIMAEVPEDQEPKTRFSYYI
jgi:hypothetical protein